MTTIPSLIHLPNPCKNQPLRAIDTLYVSMITLTPAAVPMWRALLALQALTGQTYPAYAGDLEAALRADNRFMFFRNDDGVWHVVPVQDL